MSNSNCSQYEDKKCPTLPLDKQIVLNDALHAEPKDKKTNQQAWKQFLALCLGLLALPSLAFPTTPPSQTPKMEIHLNW